MGFDARMQWLGPVRKVRTVDAACLLVIVGLALKMVWSIDRAHDIGLADETIYLASGVQLFTPGYPNGDNGLPSADWGPVYSFWYAFLHLFFRDHRVDLYFFNWSLLVVLSSLAFFVFQRTLGARPLVALVVTFALLTSQYFEAWPYPVHFATLLLLCGVTLALRASTWIQALGWLLPTFLLCGYVRPEFAVGFGVCALGALITAAVALRQRRFDARKFFVPMAPAAILATALLLVFGAPIGGGRAFYAFQQHYAYGEIKHAGLDIDPWAWHNWFPIVVRDFHTASSLTEAIKVNPKAFALHIWHNVIALADEAPRVFEPVWMLPPRIHHAITWIFGAIIGAGLFGVHRAVQSGHLRGRIEFRRLGLVALALLATTVPSILIIYPRQHYLLPITAFTIALASTGLPYIARTRARETRVTPGDWPMPAVLPAVACVLALITPNRAYGWCLQSMVTGAVPLEERRYLPRIQGLAKLEIRQRVVVVEPFWGYAFYAMPNSVRLSEWIKDRPFSEYVRQQDIGVIILPESVQELVRFREDASYTAFLADPASAGFSVIDIPGTREHVAIRHDVRTALTPGPPAPTTPAPADATPDGK